MMSSKITEASHLTGSKKNVRVLGNQSKITLKLILFFFFYLLFINKFVKRQGHTKG